MNKHLKKEKRKRLSKISKKLLWQSIAEIIIYTVTVCFVIFIAKSLCDRVIWYWDDPIYQLLKYFKDYIFFFVVALLLLGWGVITYRIISKNLSYLDEVTEAAEALANPTSEPIVLSDDLAYMENELNLVREKALSNARAAKEAEQRKNDLVVYLAHDLKTPLTSVIGYLTLLRDEGQISPELREKYLSISLEKAERLEDLINEFFEITRFNLSDITLEYSRINLTRLLEQLTYEFKPMLLEKKLNCVLEAEPDLTLTCDADKMQRVFDNLLRNAVNYSFPNGTIYICAKKIDKQMYIIFKNTGNTIPKEKLNRIFEQFYRLDSARSSKSGGAGLGLAIAKEIVEHHKGTICAKSENETVEFHVTLPLP